MPRVLMRIMSMPWATRYPFTEAALRCDSELRCTRFAFGAVDFEPDIAERHHGPAVGLLRFRFRQRRTCRFEFKRGAFGFAAGHVGIVASHLDGAA